ncbi:MAG: PAS domain S-box protein [Actinomycetota bacterium]|nr:PAS domain S-box protein [Actinomycetota bacterium]
MEKIIEKFNKKRSIEQSRFFTDPEFWSIVSIFILISLHYYDNLTTFRLFSLPDLPLGITRHTVDRMLYLVPIALSSLVFGLKGGLITVAFAFLTMLPRALFFSSYEAAALIETFIVTLFGSLIPFGSVLYRKQEQQLEATKGRLELSEKKYKQLFESAHDAIWVQDLSGKVVAANQAAAELLGYDLQELIGMDSQKFLAHENLAQSKAIQKNLLNGDERRQPYRQVIVRKDGSKAYIMLTANSVSSNGHPNGVQFIGRDITNEVRMQENQRFYLHQITRAHEEERLRISRDLHDSTAQSLIATIRSLEKFCEEETGLPKDRLELLHSYKMQLKNVLQEIRQISRDLRPSIIDDLGLIPAVEWLVEQFKTDYGIATNLTVLGQEREFSSEVEVTLFRIIQEALRNIAKYAEATEVWINIIFEAKETIINIIDNGKGFEIPASLGELSRLGKLGLDGMRTRARLVGGTFDIQSVPGAGTAIVVIIPVS